MNLKQFLCRREGFDISNGEIFDIVNDFMQRNTDKKYNTNEINILFVQLLKEVGVLLVKQDKRGKVYIFDSDEKFLNWLNNNQINQYKYIRYAPVQSEKEMEIGEMIKSKKEKL